MASACANCGRGLSTMQRVRGQKLCDACDAAAKSARDQALAEYPAALSAVIDRGAGFGPQVDRLRQLETTIAAAGSNVDAKRAELYRSFLDHALADEVLTREEEAQIMTIGSAVYPDVAALQSVLAPYRDLLFVTMVNDGRLPTVESDLMRKKGEVVHLVESAALLKEVVQREFRAGSRGYSFRVMKGVSYRIGSMRGQVVEVGRSWVDADEGELTITSQRAVFTGMRKTIEMPYAKLLDLNVFSDAVQIHLSNRQNPPTFRVSSGQLVAAAINAAMQRQL
jgi:hypothetical protein